MRIFKRLGRNQRGAGAVEFALIAPVLFGFIFAVAQLGILFFANAGLRNAVGEGARLATLYPRPSDAQIIARITEKKFGLDPAYLVGPRIVNGTSADGASYADITMSYSAPMNFLMFDMGPIKLTKTRRVYTQPAG